MVATLDVATHLLPLGVQLPDQMKLLGELEQVAVSVTTSPVFGALLSD